jgi:hypothetical protein
LLKNKSQPRRYSIGKENHFFGDVDEDGYIVEDNYEDHQNFDPLMIIEKIKMPKICHVQILVF